MSKPKTIAILGAGRRGRAAYGDYIKKHPNKVQVVAVAEPNKDRRKLFSEEHGLSSEAQFTGWKELLKEDQLANGIIISTLDNMHVKPALHALEKGYKVLLEKPIAPDLEGVKKIYEKYKKTNGTVIVAHVLRYTRLFQKLKQLIEEGIIGKVRFVDIIENIGFYHFAHSYVRGNWRDTTVAAPIILAKSCHDLDIIHWILSTKTKKLSSHASREVFRSEQQPEGAADRCLDCPLESQCPYSARKIYLSRSDGSEWPASVISTDHSYQGRVKALREGPYGRCVWQCDNNVPEVQRVNMTQTDNTEVNFALTAFSQKITRQIKLFGSKGEIKADLEQGTIEIHRFEKEDHHNIEVKPLPGGHSGGDTGLMDRYVGMLEGNIQSNNDLSTSLEESVESHIMAFAAEESREKGTIIELKKWREEFFKDL